MQPRVDSLELAVGSSRPEEAGILDASTPPKPIRMVLAKGLVWVDQGTQVIVVDELRGHTYVLQGAEAALWGWLALGYSFSKIAKLLAAMLQKNVREAENILSSLLYKWCEGGLMVPGESPDG